MTTTRAPRTLYALTAVAALLAIPGCAKVVSGSASRDPLVPRSKPTDCEQVSAPLTPIEPRTASEPQLKIPQPPGWERVPKFESEVIRFTMRNKDLVANSFMPTAVVTLEAIPGDTVSTNTIFDQERAALIEHLGATGLQISETTRCGNPAELVDYDAPSIGRIPPRKIRTLMVDAPLHGTTYVATVTVQSTDPDNAAYTRDTGTVLAGFEMLPPATS